MKINGFEIYSSRRTLTNGITVEFAEASDISIKKIEHAFFSGERVFLLTEREIDKLLANRATEKISKSKANEIKCDKIRKMKPRTEDDVLRGK